ncbi:hypothetical protein [Egicoccus sp. AB-alg2]|uniref:hypothetical protein n=1 Tax=Egicoccus sp. AB-alg2 TaxID=3242693 RepID=UPI00359D39A8
MERWHLAVLANGIVSVAYLSIAAHILLGVHRTRSWRSNPLAVATGLIFLTCSAGHLGHLVQLVSSPGHMSAGGHVYPVPLLLADGATAVIAIRYWLLRGRFPALVRGAAVFEDLATRRTEALMIHDEVVQQLATAKLAFELGEQEAGMRALERGLDASRNIVTSLVGDETASTATMTRGGLRRSPT